MDPNEDLNNKSWYAQKASRHEAEDFLNKCEHGEIGHALIQSGPSGWTITGSDKSFSTVEGLLRSRTLKFPRVGEFGSPNRVEPAPGGTVGTARSSMSNVPLPVQVPLNPPPPTAGVGAGGAVPYENNEALDKVLACLVNPNVKTLELFSMDLSSLPSEVKDLIQLQQIYLSNNKFTAFPPEIHSLINLKTLWIQANELTALPEEMGMLTNLEKFKLSNNKIQTVGGFPSSMSKMTSLKEIWVEGNQFTAFPSELLLVTSLQRIFLDQNKISSIPAGISQLKKLQRLSMNRNELTSIPAEIGQCIEMEKMWMNENTIITLPPEICQCVKLHTLALANNKITTMPDLSALKELVDLRLENNPFSDNGGTALMYGCGDATSSNSVPNSPVAGGGGGAIGVASSAMNASGTVKHNEKKQPYRGKSVFRLFGTKRGDKEGEAYIGQQLHAAIQANDCKLAKKLLKDVRKAGFDTNTMLDAEGLTPLNAAVKANNFEIVNIMTDPRYLTKEEVNTRDKLGYTSLHWAVRGADDAILLKLLKFNGIQVDILNHDHNTPLHYFCEKNHSPECEKIGQMLIEKGAKVNQQNSNGETSLHKAIFNNSVRLMMVRLLIKNGANVNITTLKSETPLHYAVYLRREDLVTMLLKAGADLSIRTHDNRTPYEVAIKDKSERIARLLKDCEDLMNWLKQQGLEQYFRDFIKEDIFMDQLPDLDNDLLENTLGIKTAGHRLKLVNACTELRTQRQLSTMAKHSADLQVEQPPQFLSNAADAEKKYLDELTNGMNLQDGEWIKFEELELLRELGAGASGKVFEGLFKGKQVAVKVLKELTDGAETEDFKKELEIMTAIRDPHMVFFYGVCIKPKMCMVMEFCARGSLFHVLNKKGLNIGWPQILEWGAQAAGGTACLHSHNIVHRDLKSLNLLVTEGWVIKVCDFGLARFNNEGNLETLNKMRGTMAYCPPEAYFAQPFDNHSDVYSLAIIIWELVNRCIKGKYEAPFSEYKNLTMDFQIIIQVAKSGLRPSIPEGCPESVVSLITRSWVFERSDRPDAVDVQNELRGLLKEYETKKSEWDGLIKTP